MAGVINIMPQVSPLATILHATVIYLFLFLALRLLGRYELAQISPMNLLLLLIISESISNSLTQGDSSLGTAIISATTLLALTTVLSVLKYKYSFFRRLAGATSKKVIDHGTVDRRVMRRELMTWDDLMTELRENGVDDIAEVKEAYIEEDGRISVMTQDKR
jgi:uncharacterized membrane protein YcaP (DUF421 family)